MECEDTLQEAAISANTANRMMRCDDFITMVLVITLIHKVNAG
jgi:hypothetical protein